MAVKIFSKRNLYFLLIQLNYFFAFICILKFTPNFNNDINNEYEQVLNSEFLKIILYKKK